MNKMVIVNPLPSYKTLCNILFIQDMLNEGIDVEYWNVSNFTWGWKYSLKHGEPHYPQRVIENEAEFKTALASLDKSSTLINMQVWESTSLQGVARAIKEKGFLTSAVLGCPLPSYVPPLACRIKNKLTQPFLSTLARVLNRTSRPLSQKSSAPIVGYPNIVFAQGQLGARRYPLARNVPCNWVDYEQWLVEKSAPAQPEAVGSCVFLDDALCTHPDFELLCAESKMTSDRASMYYASMCKLFDSVEQKLGIPVVIAAHPKSQYIGDEFGGRKIIRGATLACMRGAKMAIAHASATIGQAAIYKIPLVLATCGVMNTCFKNDILPNIKAWGIALRLKIVDADKIHNNIDEYLNINLDAYRNFLDMYYTWPQYRKKVSGPDVAKFIKSLSFR